MIYNGIGNGMNSGIGGGVPQAAKQPSFLAALLSAVDPEWLLIGVGGLALYAIFAGGKKDKKKSPPAVEKASVGQLPNGSATAKATAQSAVNKDEVDVSDPYESMSEEELQKELIRQAMSELGKRSAAARARKAAEKNHIALSEIKNS